MVHGSTWKIGAKAKSRNEEELMTFDLGKSHFTIDSKNFDFETDDESQKEQAGS